MNPKSTTRGDIDTGKRAFEIAEKLKQVTRPIVLDDEELEGLIRAFEQSQHTRQFLEEFVEVLASPLTFVGDLTHDFLRNESPKVLLWLWNNHLCPICSISFYHRVKAPSRGVRLSAMVPLFSDEYKKFRQGASARFIMLRRRKVVAAYTLLSDQLDPSFWDLLEYELEYESVNDVAAGKLWVEAHIDGKPSPAKALQFGWATRLEGELSTAIRFFRSPDLALARRSEEEAVSRSSFGHYFHEQHKVLERTYKSFAEAFSTADADPCSIVQSPKRELVDQQVYCDFISQVMACSWFCSSRTSLGRGVPSVELDGRQMFVPLDIVGLGLKVSEFWKRIPFEYPFYWHRFFGDCGCPMDQQTLFRSLPRYRGDVEKGWRFAKALLAEAVSLKQWTIPSGAYVQLDIGEIKAVKLFEIGRDVACILVNQAGEHWLVWVCPADETFEFTHRLDMATFSGLLEAAGSEKDIQEKITLGVVIPLAAIVRDFWVVEERQRVFGKAIRSKKFAHLLSDRKIPSIVYLPRVRYVSDIKTLPEPLHLEKRRPHFVTGHLRRAVEASEKQIFLAERYGIVVPEGFTFVRPHRRGDKAQEAIYRSRSALQCIRALTLVETTDQQDDWFAFELRVKRWLEKHGYDVDHLAGSRNGDGGVDIQATKSGEVLFVQCKYWKSEKIGPDVIRELMGTLTQFPAGSRGVIVTSSSLTDGAKGVAEKNGIQYLENVNFNIEINRSLPFLD